MSLRFPLYCLCLTTIAVGMHKNAYAEPPSVQIFSLNENIQAPQKRSTNIAADPSVEIYTLDTSSTPKTKTSGSKLLTRTNTVQPYNYNGISEDKLPFPTTPVNTKNSKAPVNFEADHMDHDKTTGIVSAQGDVRIKQEGRTLTADKVAYNINKDAIQAVGNVRLEDNTGDVFYASAIELQNGQKDAYVTDLRSSMTDGSQFTAITGQRIDGNKIVMKDASYTPCRPCGEQLLPATQHTDGYTPVWQLRASEAVHDKEDHEMRYRNARFEVYGVPVLYAPYFFHPDGSIDRKSGFLSPEAGFKSRLGTFVNTRYYWDIAPEQDATVGLIAMTREAPLVHGEWRKRWNNASFELNGGTTYSSRLDDIAGTDTEIKEEWRGHILADGRWDINDKWRSGLNVEWASDDQYFRQYDFLDKDILESELYAERFSGRNYAAGRLLTFQDIRVKSEQEEQPEVLPEIIASFKGAPNSVPVLGGRWGLDTAFLGLEREGKGIDVNRLNIIGNWQRHFISDTGLSMQAEASLRGDVYNVRNQQNSTENNSTETRLAPIFHLKNSYPLAKPLKNAQAILEPTVAVTLAPNLNENNSIPNEDSKDVQIDAANLFNANRFPGLDKIEDRSRITYGVRSGVFGDNGNQATIFLGQSYRFDDDDNLFPAGSGLEDQSSDIVGQIGGHLDGRHSLNYNFQLDNSHLNAQRHEVDARAEWKRLSLSSQYLFAKQLAGTDLTDTREQIKGGIGYYLTPSWRIQTSTTHDLGVDPGLRQAYLGIDHFGQCVSWRLSAERNLTDDTSGESNTEIYFRIGLKNLGEFEESGIKTGCRNQK